MGHHEVNTAADDGPTLLSLSELQVELSQDVSEFFLAAYRNHYEALSDANAGQRAVNRHAEVLAAMKRPPAKSILRVNGIMSSSEEVIEILQSELQKWSQDRSPDSALDIDIGRHPLLEGVVTVTVTAPDDSEPLSCYRTPPSSVYPRILPEWPLREHHGWPMSHKVVVVDRLCAEAILRGSDIFVRGILAADSGIVEGQEVAVYGDLSSTAARRGMLVEKYLGRCLFLGLGTSACRRSVFFSTRSGLGVRMSILHRVGPVLPPMAESVLFAKAMLQNLPSTLVAHILEPQPGDAILDMCAAPGGKTLHVASLVRNDATIIAVDRSRSKMTASRDLFQLAGANCITPLVMDSTRSVSESTVSLKEALATAARGKNGFVAIQGFLPGTFDRILLDPPCSALGLRPKLRVAIETVAELQSFADRQRKLVACAVQLLKPGGVLTYSTCTTSPLENEAMVAHTLVTYPELELLPIDAALGAPGLAGQGLDEAQRHCVRRFDPSDQADTIGFFLAKFCKLQMSI